MTVEGDGPGICPVCRSEDDYRVPTFTLWGGMVGHRVLDHVYCNQCGIGFNRATGQSNLTRIIFYQIAIVGLVAAISIFLLILMFNI